MANFVAMRRASPPGEQADWAAPGVTENPGPTN